MARDGSGVYSKPSGTTAVANTTIESAKFNSVIDDIAADLNVDRPIVAGGTGASSASAARTNLGLVIGTNVAAFDALNKLDATAAPTASDDASDTSGNGVFAVGSKWTDVTNKRVYFCVDSTATAAIWKDATPGSMTAGTAIASASSPTIPVDGEFFSVTGTTGITSFVVGANRIFTLEFAASLTLTHGANLELPSDANYVTVAGEMLTFYSDGANAVKLVGFQGADLQHRQFKGADVASASELPVLRDGNFFHVTGTTTVTSIANLVAGIEVTLVFDGILTLTHNATSLILITGANITTAVGDTAKFRQEDASGNWRMTDYTRKDGTPLAASSELTIRDSSLAESTTSNTTAATDLYRYEVPAGEWATGDVFNLKLNALVQPDVGSRTVTYGIYIGTTKVYEDTTTGLGATAQPINFDLNFHCIGGNANSQRMQGSINYVDSGTVVATGEGPLNTGSTIAVVAGSAAENSAAALDIAVEFTMSSADASFSVTHRMSQLTRLRNI
jgi:hypothetical protein